MYLHMELDPGFFNLLKLSISSYTSEQGPFTLSESTSFSLGLTMDARITLFLKRK